MAIEVSHPKCPVRYHGSLTAEHGIYDALPSPLNDGRFALYHQGTERVALNHVGATSITDIPEGKYTVCVYTDCVEIAVHVPSLGEWAMENLTTEDLTTEDGWLFTMWTAESNEDPVVRNFISALHAQHGNLRCGQVTVYEMAGHIHRETD